MPLLAFSCSMASDEVIILLYPLFEIIASSPGYEDKTITVNTYVNKDKLYTLKLKKAPKGGANVRPKTPPPGDKPGGEAHKPLNKTGGELNGNPFKNDTAPAKKP